MELPLFGARGGGGGVLVVVERGRVGVPGNGGLMDGLVQLLSTIASHMGLHSNVQHLVGTKGVGTSNPGLRERLFAPRARTACTARTACHGVTLCFPVHGGCFRGFESN